MLNGQGYAHRCGECDEEPTWQLLRRGDVATNWACTPHLAVVADDLQRDWEITELIVTHWQKSLEWAEISASLRNPS